MSSNDMKLSPKGYAVLKEYEQGPKGGFSPVIYIDDTGNPTAGWGHLILPGEKFKFPLSATDADDLLRKDVISKESTANRLLFKCGIKATQNQFDALVCLIFNVGAGVRDGVRGDVADSDIMMHWMNGDLTKASMSFLDWNKGRVKGKLVALSGLTRRRNTESLLFRTGEVKFQF